MKMLKKIKNLNPTETFLLATFANITPEQLTNGVSIGSLESFGDESEIKVDEPRKVKKRIKMNKLI